MSESKESTGFPIGLLILGTAVGVTAFFAMGQDYVAAGATVLVTLTGFCGYRAGALKIVGFLVAAGLAAALAPAWGESVTTQLGLDTLRFGGDLVGPLLVGSGVMLAGLIVTHLLTHFVVHRVPVVNTLNRWTGFALGAVQGVGVALLFVGGILVAEQVASQRVAQDSGGVAGTVAQGVVAIAGATRESALGPWIERNNPFTRIEALQGMKAAMEGRGTQHALFQ